MSLLKEGDVIHLKKGHEVYATIPSMFVYGNRLTSTKPCESRYVIGETLHNTLDICKSAERVVNGVVERFSWEGFDLPVETARQFVTDNVPAPQSASFVMSPGDFVVIRTEYTGGGTGHGPHDTYPGGHKVTCQQLKNGKYDPKGEIVSFYQDGCFSAMIKDIEPIRQMSLSYQ